MQKSNDLRRMLPGLLISLVFILIIGLAIDWPKAWQVLLTIQPAFWALHGVFYFCSTASRAAAARVLLEERPSFRDSFVVMMQGYFLNNILPFRLGELGRAYLLGRKTGLGTFNALPAIVIERFYDLAFAAVLLISTLPFVLTGVDWARPVAYSTLAVVAAGLLSLHLVARFRTTIKTWVDGLAHKIPFVEKYILPQIDSFLDGLAVLTNVRRFGLSLFWMAVAWLFGVANQYALLRGFLSEATPLQSTFAFAVSSFGGAIPSAPSGVGVYEGSVMFALDLLKVAGETAFAFAFTHHVMHIVYSSIVALYGFSRDEIGVMDLYHRLLEKKMD